MPDFQHSYLSSVSSCTQICKHGHMCTNVLGQGHLAGKSKFLSSYPHYIDEGTTPNMNDCCGNNEIFI